MHIRRIILVASIVTALGGGAVTTAIAASAGPVLKCKGETYCHSVRP
jgi:hypothetical protein